MNKLDSKKAALRRRKQMNYRNRLKDDYENAKSEGVEKKTGRGGAVYYQAKDRDEQSVIKKQVAKKKVRATEIFSEEAFQGGDYKKVGCVLPKGA